MAHKARGKPLPQNKSNKKIGQILRRAARPGGVVHDWMAALTRQQREDFHRIATKVDTEFLLTKVTLMKDTLAYLLGHKEDPVSPLLQRSIWSSFDDIATYFDKVGVTRAIRTVSRRIVKRTRLDEPRLVQLESDLASAAFGGDAEMASLGISRVHIEEVIKYAEKHRLQACGLPRIISKNSSFAAAVAENCGRPDKMFEVVIHSPATAKLVIEVVIFVANVISLIVGVAALASSWLTNILGAGAAAIGLVVAVMTAIVIWIIGSCGC